MFFEENNMKQHQARQQAQGLKEFATAFFEISKKSKVSKQFKQYSKVVNIGQYKIDNLESCYNKLLF